MQDDALARYVEQTGMATRAQIDEARKLFLPLGEALVRIGALTAAQREAAERKLEAGRGVDALGGFRLLKKLGEGGMGAVYLGEDESKRRVAIKVLPRELKKEPEFVKRFRREAVAAANLDHPAIVRAITAGEERGHHYFVMEFCEGAPLGKRLPLPFEQATDIVIRVAEGLAFAHKKGVIHRDIKPDNLMILADGAVKILDFGLAKNLEATDASFRTTTGVTMGTPHYISPEQARGLKEIDGRADIYSLGATYYHLLTGRTPFTGNSAFDIIHHHLTSEVPRDLPGPVGGVIGRMMAKDPADRFRDCDELLAALRILRQGGAPPARKRNLVPWFAVAGGALALLALAWILLPGKKDEPKPQAPPAGSADLIPRIDLARDSFNGTWRLENGVLVSPPSGENFGSGPVRFQIRHDFPDEYDLEIVAQRTEGREDLVIGLPVAGKQIGFGLDGWGGAASGLHVNGFWNRRREGAVFADGREHRITCVVRRTGIRVDVDGLRILEHSGFDALSLPGPNQGSDPRAVVIGSIRSVYRVSRIRLSRPGQE